MRARFYIYVLICLATFSFVEKGSAKEAEREEILESLGRSAEDTVVSGRFPRLLSRTPENVTVITAVEIEKINAHTLADVLLVIPGVQVENLTGPASPSFTLVQGSNYNHVLVLLDGVPINNLGDNFSDVGLIPARIIERVEIVKGAASSAWGQALGGVINVFTKEPDIERKAGGAMSMSYGERHTGDAGAEVSGTVGNFGYYLSGGYFGSGGFHANNGVDLGSGYAKISYQLPKQANIVFTLHYARAGRGDFAYLPWDIKFNDDSKRTISTATYRGTISSGVDFEISAHHSVNLFGNETKFLSSGQSIQSIHTDERSSGGTTKFLWRANDNILSVGLDYDHVSMKGNDSLVQVDKLDRKNDRFGFFLNDTLTLGQLSVSSGIRYDHTGSPDDQISPSLGATYQLGNDSTVRGYTARGYSLPAFSLERQSERVWTSQIGIESSAIPYLWLKGTLFRNKTWNITLRDPQTGEFYHDKNTLQGIETEVKTTPLFNTSFSAGYTHVDARRDADNSVVKDVPRHTVQLGVHFDDKDLLRGVLNGRYIDWNADAFRNGSYGSVLWDLFLTITPLGREQTSPELFFSLRNIFDSQQYLDEIYKNSGRWLEGGVRFKF